MINMRAYSSKCSIRESLTIVTISTFCVSRTPSTTNVISICILNCIGNHIAACLILTGMVTIIIMTAICFQKHTVKNRQIRSVFKIAVCVSYLECE